MIEDQRVSATGGPAATGAGGSAATGGPAATGVGARGVSPSAVSPNASPARPALSMENVSFTYPVPPASEPERPTVLRDAALSVPDGAFALLVGGTGSGKSTLLSLVKPQIAPAGERTGIIELFGEPVEALDDERSARTVGFVFQDPATQVLSDTVWHEMAFGLENLGTPRGEMRRRIAEVAYFLGMDSWFSERTDTLSGGRKQLLALAATLAMRPRLLLLDEPTSQLDPIAEKTFLHALFRVNRELGCTVLVATHRPQPMIDYATCAFKLDEGSVREVCDLDELRFDGGVGESCGSVCSTGGAPGAPVAVAAALDPERASGATPAPSPAPAACVPASPSSAPAVSLESAWFRYGRDGDWVLRGLDLQVAAGSIHALVGGNGCGKSTLLSLMAGINPLRRGSLRVPERSIALLPQDPCALFAAETVLDELMEWSGEGGYGEAEVHEVMRALRLGHRARLHPYDLSGGQRQLLALAKILLMRPRLLLLDEPTKGLDTRARRVVANALRSRRDAGATIVMASHDLAFVRDVADEVSMVFDGQVACTDPAPAFFRDNLFYRA